MSKWVLVIALVACGSSKDSPKQFTFTEIKPGIYHAIATGSIVAICNAVIIVNKDDVLIVDSHVSPEAANVLLAELKQITPKPVKYVVNTHFHFDHTGGNQVFPPSVEIIGHELTRQTIVDKSYLQGRGYKKWIGGAPDELKQMEAQLAAEKDPAKKAELEKGVAEQRSFVNALKEVVMTPPTLTIPDHMTLYRGGREIQLHFFGRAHTGGDILVYLPAEKILISGDVIVDGLGYMGDGFLEDWIKTLDEIAKLDFDTILPGHGNPLKGKASIQNLQAYMRDLHTQILALATKGVSAEDAAKQIDMRAHAKNFPQIKDVGVDEMTVLRVYDLQKASN
jgi:cyclase